VPDQDDRVSTNRDVRVRECPGSVSYGFVRAEQLENQCRGQEGLVMIMGSIHKLSRCIRQGGGANAYCRREFPTDIIGYAV